MQNLEILLLLKNIPKLGNVSICSIISKLKNNIQQILTLDKQQLLQLGLNNIQTESIMKPNWQFSNRQLELATQHQVEIISILDPDYPTMLKQIHDPPPLLYVKGNKKILSSELFAIVGTRRPTVYGKQMAAHFSAEILSCGYIVTSGFAKGVDIIAQLTATKKQQPTVTVLGTSLDCIYPYNHQQYIENIISQGGVIITEAKFTTYPDPTCFPKRNRIISGLSKGVLVVEAARKSGSLITARCALEQGREVFAIPGNINNQQALGCLDLIANGAKLTMKVEDIVEELCGIKNNYKFHNTKRASVTHAQQRMPDLFTQKDSQYSVSCEQLELNPNRSLSATQQNLLNSLSGGLTAFDDIIADCRLSIEEIAAHLIQLEIMGLIVQEPGGYVKT